MPSKIITGPKYEWEETHHKKYGAIFDESNRLLDYCIGIVALVSQLHLIPTLDVNSNQELRQGFLGDVISEEQ